MARITIVGGKGQKHDVCICVDNIDLQSGRCAITHGANGEYVKENACNYCYSKYTFSKTKYSIKPAITVTDLQKEIQRRNKEKTKLQDTSKTVKTIRLGKMVDVWDPLNTKQSKETLLSVLRAGNALKKPLMIMSKLLPYDEDIAKELLVQNSSLHYSLGDDKLELGGQQHKMTNSRRIEEAIKYHNKKCNIYLRLVVDVVQPQTEWHRYLESTNIPLLITPLRYSSKELFETNTGLNWNDAKNSEQYSYHKGAMRPNIIHASWGGKYKHAFCGVVNFKTGAECGCNACGLFDGKKRWGKDN